MDNAQGPTRFQLDKLSYLFLHDDLEGVYIEEYALYSLKLYFQINYLVYHYKVSHRDLNSVNVNNV